MKQTVCDICEIPMSPGDRHHEYGICKRLLATADPMVHWIDVCDDCNEGVGNLVECFIRGATPPAPRRQR